MDELEYKNFKYHSLLVLSGKELAFVETIPDSSSEEQLPMKHEAMILV